MLARFLTRATLAAVAGAGMFATTMVSAPAFTLSAPPLEQNAAAFHVENVYYREYGYHHYHYHHYHHYHHQYHHHHW